MGLWHHQHSWSHRRFWFGYAVKPKTKLFATAIIDEDTFIREIIDTDFGGRPTGIYRDIPDRSIDYVHSPYAPDSESVKQGRKMNLVEDVL